MKNVFLSLAIAASLACSVSAFASQDKVQDKATKSALHRIDENCKLVNEYAPIFEWDNVDNEVDRIVAAEKRVQKALAGNPEMKQQAEELHQAVKELRAARFHQDPDQAVAASEKVDVLIRELSK